MPVEFFKTSNSLNFNNEVSGINYLNNQIQSSSELSRKLKTIQAASADASPSEKIDKAIDGSDKIKLIPVNSSNPELLVAEAQKGKTILTTISKIMIAAAVVLAVLATNTFIVRANEQYIFERAHIIAEKAKNAYLQERAYLELNFSAMLRPNVDFSEIDNLVKVIKSGTYAYDERKMAFGELRDFILSVDLSPVSYGSFMRNPTFEELADDSITDNSGHFKPGFLEKIDPIGEFCFEFKQRYNITCLAWDKLRHDS